MCGRFTLFPEDYAELARLTGAEADAALAEHYRQRYNTAPLQHSLIVRAERESRVLDYPESCRSPMKVRLPDVVQFCGRTPADQFGQRAS